jgi:hypothetical protein
MREVEEAVGDAPDSATCGSSPFGCDSHGWRTKSETARVEITSTGTSARYRRVGMVERIGRAFTASPARA